MTRAARQALDCGADALILDLEGFRARRPEGTGARRCARIRRSDRGATRCIIENARDGLTLDDLAAVVRAHHHHAAEIVGATTSRGSIRRLSVSERRTAYHRLAAHPAYRDRSRSGPSPARSYAEEEQDQGLRRMLSAKIATDISTFTIASTGRPLPPFRLAPSCYVSSAPRLRGSRIDAVYTHSRGSNSYVRRPARPLPRSLGEGGHPCGRISAVDEAAERRSVARRQGGRSGFRTTRRGSREHRAGHVDRPRSTAQRSSRRRQA